MQRIPTVEISASLADKLGAGHPWIYRDHLPRGFTAEAGQWVRVKAGRFIGYALFDAESPIALRVFSERGVPDRAWISERVRSALKLRAPLRKDGVTAYRWINGENDGLPGIVVDLYDRFAVVVTYFDAVRTLLSDLCAALADNQPLFGIVERREQGELRTLWGKAPSGDVVIEEYGVLQKVDLQHGQKTGLFLDQRDNRRHVAKLCFKKRVLNLFCYTGGFSLHAAKSGASRIVNVDASGPALAAARDNFALNGLPLEGVEFVTLDVFEFLAKSHSERYDVAIVDPPSFARSREQLDRALQAYARLHGQALGLVELEGLYVASSCTAQVTPEAFRQVLGAAARVAKRRLQIIHDVGQPLDHPVMAGYPEGRYLKFIVARVLPIA
jgi:23S rRNA (cytosine1962-C5)-methyltransferase